MPKYFYLFGAGFGIDDEIPDDDILTWVHELTEMFLNREMDITYEINISSIEHMLETKDFSGLMPWQTTFSLYHLASPYGGNCLIGYEENRGK